MDRAIGTSPPDATLTTLWAVLVGIDTYDDSLYPRLEFCGNDAVALGEVLSDEKRGGYPEANICLLQSGAKNPSRQPSQPNILQALRRLAAQAGPADTIVFGFFGHGETRDGENYLISSTTYHGDLAHTAVPLDHVQKILADSRARARVVILDACHSGTLADGRSGPQVSPEVAVDLYESVSTSHGWAVLAACRQKEFSYDYPEKQHGAFTYFLLEALSGACVGHSNVPITVTDAYRYTRTKTQTWANANNRSQTPELHCNVDGDIALLLPPDREEYRRLFAPIISVMGTRGGTGKTTTIAAIAGLMASNGGNVVIIDADIDQSGSTDYWRSRARHTPVVESVLDGCFDRVPKPRGRAQRAKGNQGAWDVTPEGLRRIGTGQISLIPARLAHDTRVGYEPVADFGERRNALALEYMRELVDRAFALPMHVNCVLIDCGAENNPLVSAGIVSATYGFCMSSPDVASVHHVPRLELMHRERYPDLAHRNMYVVVNRAEPETRGLWSDQPGIRYFLPIDEDVRRGGAIPGASSEWLGLSRFYFDVLKIMKDVCRDNAAHHRLFPDELEVWVKPYLAAMQKFPEAKLESWAFQWLRPVTFAQVLLAVLVIALATWSLLTTGDEASRIVTTREIRRDGDVTDIQFDAELARIVVPAQLRERVWIEGRTLNIRGDLTPSELEALRAASAYPPYRDALTIASSEAGTVVAAERQRIQQARWLSYVVSALAVGTITLGVWRYRDLRKKQRVLRTVIAYRDGLQDVTLASYMNELLTADQSRPELRWLREEFEVFSGRKLVLARLT